MSPVPGSRLGAYEILAPLGAGGMGEVYRARDTKLGRDVALKILPDTVAADGDRVARFRREAQLLASLNHPHIGAIYGLEEAPGDGGRQVLALVLELVEGPTLADRIAQGPVPLSEALAIARQMADALAEAHEKGIIHRDLKPANVALTADDQVKVLDFGLAKMLEAGGAGRSGGSGRAGGNLTNSPTLTSPAMMTGVGAILGTAAYMSPEQAKGREADRRSDVWAFGCVLFEMLSGRRAFPGDDVADTLAAVLRAEPDWAALPRDVPTPIVTLLRGCLEKDRRNRVADVSTVMFVLTRGPQLVERLDAPLAALQPATVRRPRWRGAAWLAAAAGVSALVASTGVWLLTRPAPPPLVITTITTSGSTELTRQGSDRDIAITPDGLRIVYRGDNQLLVRALNQPEPKVLSGLGAARGVFISPDGQSVGFFAGSTIKKVAITGGAPEEVGAIQGKGDPRGATWGADDTIIFAASSRATGLYRVSASGGEPVLLTTPSRERGESDHMWPEFLPDGESVLFTIRPNSGGIENSQIAVLDLKTGAVKVLFRGGSHARYVPTGHLIYGAAGTLRAVPFDLGRREILGTHEQVLAGVVMTANGAVDVAVAANGSLVYVPGGIGGAGRRTVVSLDRQGRPTPLPGLPPDAYRDVRVSRDGARLAVSTDTGVSTYDVRRAALSGLTTDTNREFSPLWTPDGERIVYTSNPEGYPELFWRPADGSGSGQRILTRGKDLLDLIANGWAPDGRLLFTEVPGSIQCAIWQAAIDPPSAATRLLKSESCNAHAAVSPNGRWVAYRSRSERDEVYVQRYPALGGRVQISTRGGTIPVWSSDGRELFFISLNGRQMFSVAMQTGTTVNPGRPQVLFEFAMPTPVGGSRPYDIAPDGRFVAIQSDQTEVSGDRASNLILMQNWFEELKRLVPTN